MSLTLTKTVKCYSRAREHETVFLCCSSWVLCMDGSHSTTRVMK